MTNEFTKYGREIGGITPVAKDGSAAHGVIFTLNTRPAFHIWKGRAKGERSRGIIGIHAFAARLKSIHAAIKEDDPYADFVLLSIERAIVDLKVELEHEAEAMNSFLAESVPEEMTLPAVGSNEPARVECRFASPIAFQLAMQIVAADRIFRQVLLAFHIGVLDKEQKYKAVSRITRAVRGPMYRVFDYHFTGVTRDDIRANNQRAQIAIGKMGHLSSEVLAGSERAQYAPSLPSRRVATLNKAGGKQEPKAGAKTNKAAEPKAAEVKPDTELGAKMNEEALIDPVAPKPMVKRPPRKKEASA